MPKLIFVPVAKLGPACPHCQRRPGFYRAVWEVEGHFRQQSLQEIAAQMEQLQKHPLFGVTVCVN